MSVQGTVRVKGEGGLTVFTGAASVSTRETRLGTVKSVPEFAALRESQQQYSNLGYVPSFDYGTGGGAEPRLSLVATGGGASLLWSIILLFGACCMVAVEPYFELVAAVFVL